MTFKQRFEENFTLGVIGVGIAAFIAGFGAYAAIQKASDARDEKSKLAGGIAAQESKVVPSPFWTFDPNKAVERLTDDHLKHIAELRTALLREEKEAGDPVHIESVKQTYVESVQRIEKMIREENQAYGAKVSALRSLPAK